MALLINENFQGSSSIPADITTSTGGGGTISLSTTTSPQLYGPNSLLISGGGNIVAYSTISDKSNGNITITGSIMFSGAFTPGSVGHYGGPVIDVGAYGSVSAAGSNQYEFSIWNGTATPCALLGWISGTQGLSSYSSGNGNFTTGVWYTMTLTRNNATLWCVIKREDTQQWLSPTGSWQSDYIAVIVATDGSPLASSASHGGIFGLSATNTNIANVFVSDQVTNIPAGPLKGADITSTFLPSGWAPTSTQGWFTQIDLAKTIGVNCVRTQPNLYYAYQGYATLSQELPQLLQVIAYAKKKGVWVIVGEDETAPYGSLHTFAEASAQMITDRVTIARAIASYPNVCGFILANEIDLNSTWNMYAGTASVAGTLTVTTAQYVSFLGRCVAAIKAVAPNLPLTMSFATGTPPGAQGQYANIAYLCDYLDNHVYATPTVSLSNIYSNYVGTYGKKIFLGEFGGLNLETQATINTRINAIWTDIVTASYSPQPGCVGGCFWALMPNAQGSLTLFPGTIPETLDPVFGVTYAGFSAPSYFFGGVGRRRRPR